MAIAHAGSHGRNSGSSTTPSLVIASGVGGTNGYLEVSLLAEASGTTVSSITYAGNAMTQVGGYLSTGDGAQSFSVWRLLNPASSGTVSVTISGSTPWQIWADSYTGVDQTTPTANVASGGAAGVITTSPTSIQVVSEANGSWHLASVKEDSAGVALSASSGGVMREVGPGGTDDAHFDSNGTVANTVTSTIVVAWTGGGQKLGYITYMLRPATSAANSTNFFTIL
jgi:hypothetical protein